MKKYKLVVLSNPVEGKEDAYNDWYTNTHLHDIVKIPGVVSAQRFRMTEAQRPDVPRGPWKYLAIYEIETNDLQAVIAEFDARRGTPVLRPSDAIASERLAYYYEAITPPVPAKGGLPKHSAK